MRRREANIRGAVLWAGSFPNPGTRARRATAFAVATLGRESFDGCKDIEAVANKTAMNRQTLYALLDELEHRFGLYEPIPGAGRKDAGRQESMYALTEDTSTDCENDEAES